MKAQHVKTYEIAGHTILLVVQEQKIRLYSPTLEKQTLKWLTQHGVSKAVYVRGLIDTSIPEGKQYFEQLWQKVAQQLAEAEKKYGKSEKNEKKQIDLP